MRFRLVDQAKKEFPVHRLCKVLGVSQSGYFAWKDRPASWRQRQDVILLAHVRSAFSLSNETYGSPRMTRELQDAGFAIGRRRTARLMRENGLQAREKRRLKRTTDSHHAWPVAPNIINQDFTASKPDENTSPTSGHARAGFIWPSLSTSSHDGWSAGLSVIVCTVNSPLQLYAKPLRCGVPRRG